MQTPSSQKENVLKGCRSALVILFVSFLLKYAISVYLARWLGPEKFGDYSVIFNVLALATTVALMGTDNAFLSLIPKFVKEKQWAKMQGYLRHSFMFLIVSSLAVLAIAYLGVVTLIMAKHYGFDINLKDYPLLIFFWLVPFLVFIAIFSRLLRGLNHYFIALMPQKILRYVFMLLLLIAFTAYYQELSLISALTITALGILFVIIIQLLDLKRVLPRALFSTEPVLQSTYWMGNRLKFFSNEIIFVAFSPTYLILLEVFEKNEASVGVFAAILQVCGWLYLFRNSLFIILSPLISVLRVSDDNKAMQHLMNKVNFFQLISSGIFFVLLLIFGMQILGFFGPGYSAGYSALVITLVGVLLETVFTSSVAVLLYAGKQMTVTVIDFIALLVTLILSAILIPLYGIMGAAIAFALSRALIGILAAIMVRRQLQIKPLFVF